MSYTLEQIELDGELVDELCEAGGFRSPSAAVNAALRDYLRQRKQARVIRLFGKIDYDSAYDYKAERGGRGSVGKPRA